MQEAQSKYSIEIEPENAVIIQPLEGNLSLDGAAELRFKRSSSAPSTGRIYCKVILLYGIPKLHSCAPTNLFFFGTLIIEHNEVAKFPKYSSLS